MSLTTTLSSSYFVDEASIPRHRTRRMIPPNALMFQLEPPMLTLRRRDQINNIPRIRIPIVAPYIPQMGQFERDIVVLQGDVVILTGKDPSALLKQVRRDVRPAGVDPGDDPEQDQGKRSRDGPHVVRFIHQRHPRVRRPETVVPAGAGEAEFFA